MRFGHGRKAELLPICGRSLGLADYKTDMRYFSRRPCGGRATRPVDQSQDVLTLALRIEVSQGNWAGIVFSESFFMVTCCSTCTPSPRIRSISFVMSSMVATS